MSSKMIMGFVFVFLVGHTICVMMEGSVMGADELNIIAGLTGIETLDITDPWWQTVLTWGQAFIGMIWRLMSWNYSFFTGYWEWFRFLVLVPISCGLAWGIVSMLRGTATS